MSPFIIISLLRGRNYSALAAMQVCGFGFTPLIRYASVVLVGAFTGAHTHAQTYGTRTCTDIQTVVDTDIVHQSTQTCVARISDNTFFTVKGNFEPRGVNVRIPRCIFA
jgi:hypothetical protein